MTTGSPGTGGGRSAGRSGGAAEPPLVALTVGDPAGIGPEIVRAALAEPRLRGALRLRVLGPGALRPGDVPLAEPDALDGPEAAAWIDTGPLGDFEPGRAQAVCGRAALDALRAGAELARTGRVAALVTAPVSKEALHLAGEPVEGQTELLARWAGATRVQMMAVAGALRVMLATRHLPLREALARIDTPLVLDHLALLDETLRGWGFARPRLALAGLNPHAGEGGLLGTEEQELLEPAVLRARELGFDVAGPLSPDTVFARARAGAFDAVLALYHDQAFIPIKLAAPDTAFTVLAGLPYLRLSPVHGTAFDIVGRGIASPAGLVASLEQAAAWAPARAVAAS